MSAPSGQIFNAVTHRLVQCRLVSVTVTSIVTTFTDVSHNTFCRCHSMLWHTECFTV